MFSGLRVLRDGLGALGNGVLGELTGEEEADGGLDLAGGEGRLLVVADELGGLTGDLLEDIVDEGVHDAHGLLGDASLGVNLLEDTVDVDGEGFDSLLLGGGDDLSGGLLRHFNYNYLGKGPLYKAEPILNLVNPRYISISCHLNGGIWTQTDLYLADLAYDLDYYKDF